MELWTEVRRRVLTGELSKRAACREYGIHWQTLAKMLQHPEPPGYRQTKARTSKLDVFLPIIDEILTSDRCESSNGCATNMVTTADGLW